MKYRNRDFMGLEDYQDNFSYSLFYPLQCSKKHKRSIPPIQTIP